jgi:hypothetical protein
MPDFQVYVDDDRYSVPSLYLIAAPSEGLARLKAEELWRSSDHHLGVELTCDGQRVCVFGTLAIEAHGGADRGDAPNA